MVGMVMLRFSLLSSSDWGAVALSRLLGKAQKDYYSKSTKHRRIWSRFREPPPPSRLAEDRLLIGCTQWLIEYFFARRWMSIAHCRSETPRVNDSKA